MQTVGDDHAADLGLLNEDGSENPALTMFQRAPPDIASLWTILDLTPAGRGTDLYPKLRY